MQCIAISSSHLQIRFGEFWVLGMLAEWEGERKSCQGVNLNSGVHITLPAKNIWSCAV